MKRRKERQERSLVPKPPNCDILICYVVVLQDDEHRVDLCVCVCVCVSFPFFFLTFFFVVVLTAFTFPPSSKSYKKMFFK